ncbi:MAG: hypothetical protein U5N53_18520 [Mycobacterium sp.]|nr:hypothetical protein [Mycobacterium sp.]
MTVPTTATPAVLITECTSCTVPTVGGELCSFCQTYTAPETIPQKIDVTVNKVDLLRPDLNEVLRELPADAPLMAVVDLVTALGHLKRAAVALDRANDALEVDAQAVTR